ncbi:hypothetical protein C2E20_1278 [Micractinium conductrix]|uniref:Uncharacterized protein n=1 Tax=Micractinium conductrix TaxID=554055 RepID=A0A2P6VNN3_9CHLO|nr:hypothetical protein C2E20_1278 [Micractinium conductrix]|eukprot:PSC75679.1 hypothetical protein C2E20_1278 [Micractinium conductrix]
MTSDRQQQGPARGSRGRIGIWIARIFFRAACTARAMSVYQQPAGPHTGAADTCRPASPHSPPPPPADHQPLQLARHTAAAHRLVLIFTTASLLFLSLGRTRAAVCGPIAACVHVALLLRSRGAAGDPSVALSSCHATSAAAACLAAVEAATGLAAAPEAHRAAAALLYAPAAAALALAAKRMELRLRCARWAAAYGLELEEQDGDIGCTACMCAV